MNKTSIKIIKRKDMLVAVSGDTQNQREPKLAAEYNEEKIESRLHRKMADTISNWISERKDNNRNKEISAIRKLFGDESLLSKTT